MKNTIIAGIAALTALGASAAPSWLEADSAAAIDSRTRADFPLTIAQFRAQLAESYPQLDDDSIVADYIAKKYIETREIDGERRVFRKALRNLPLLAPGLTETPVGRNKGASRQRIAYVDSVIGFYDGTNPRGNAHRVEYDFTVAVPYDDALAGDSLSIWLPLPFGSPRQSDLEILWTSHPQYVLSGDRSIHNTIYFKLPAPAKGDTLHVGYSAAYVARGQYFAPEFILANMKDYDRESELYRQYTATEAPHIVRLDSLARAIVGTERNPFRQSELVYDYITDKYPWAGAREYSTIDCIPAYVIESGHGDCGQVSLLYISLMRSLGVPARWESGWMLHPGEKNYHDWAEVYFEGVGWVPVDVSFGRYPNAIDPRARNFYSHGMDTHRFATNHGVCGELFPKKRFVRSETVDFQAGEIESSRGNLFYPAWDHTLKLISVTPLESEK